VIPSQYVFSGHTASHACEFNYIVPQKNKFERTMQT
jgi:hypothetical protein